MIAAPASAPVKVAALILAGGRGARMGAAVPKPLLRLGSLTLLDHVLARLGAETAPVLLSANDADAFAGTGLTLIPDRIGGFAGPLAGLDAAAAYLGAHHPGVTHLLTVPGDTPFLPSDLVSRLMAGPAGLACVARHAGALQPTVAVWPTASLDGLPGFLSAPGKHAIRGFLDLIGFAAIDFPDDDGAPGGDPFFNVNTPEDLAAASSFEASR